MLFEKMLKEKDALDLLFRDLEVHFPAVFGSSFLPYRVDDVYSLLEVKRLVFSIEALGLENVVNCGVISDKYEPGIGVNRKWHKIEIHSELASHVLGSEGRFLSSFKEAKKCIDWLLSWWLLETPGKLITKAMEEELYDEEGYFIWAAQIETHFLSDGEHFLPWSVADYRNVGKIKKLADLIEETGTEKLFSYVVRPDSTGELYYDRMCSHAGRGIFKVPKWLVEKICAPLAENEMSISFEKAKKVIEHVWTVVRSLRGVLKRAWEEGLLDREGNFLWASWLKTEATPPVLPTSGKDKKVLERILRVLNFLEKEGLQGVIYCEARRTYDGSVNMRHGVLSILPEAVSFVAGRKVKEREKISFEEAKKTIEWLFSLPP